MTIERTVDTLARPDASLPMAEQASQNVAWAKKESLSVGKGKKATYQDLKQHSVAVVGEDLAGRKTFAVQFPGNVTVQTEKEALTVLKAAQGIWDRKLHDAVVTRLLTNDDFNRIHVEMAPNIHIDGLKKAFPLGPQEHNLDLQSRYPSRIAPDANTLIVQEPRGRLSKGQRMLSVGGVLMIAGSACVVPAVTRDVTPEPNTEPTQAKIVEVVPTQSEQQRIIDSYKYNGLDLSVKVIKDGQLENYKVNGISRVIEVTNFQDNTYQSVTWAQMSIENNPDAAIESWAFQKKDGSVDSFLVAWQPNGKDAQGNILLRGVQMYVDKDNVASFELNPKTVGTAVIPNDQSLPALITMDKPNGTGNFNFDISKTVAGFIDNSLAWDAGVAEAAQITEPAPSQTAAPSSTPEASATAVASPTIVDTATSEPTDTPTTVVEGGNIPNGIDIPAYEKALTAISSNWGGFSKEFPSPKNSDEFLLMLAVTDGIVDTNKYDIKDGNGNVIATSLVSIGVYWLNNEGKLQYAKLPSLMRLPDGTNIIFYGKSALKDPQISQQRIDNGFINLMKQHLDAWDAVRGNEQFLGLRRLNAEKNPLASKAAPANFILWDVLGNYNTSWSTQIDNLEKTGNISEMEWIMPFTSIDSAQTNVKLP